MKKAIFSLMTLALVALTASCSKEDQLLKTKSICDSVELNAEGKINVLHEAYGEGSHVDYMFTYSDIKK